MKPKLIILFIFLFFSYYLIAQKSKQDTISETIYLGYQTVLKTNFSGAVGELNKDVFEDVLVANFDQTIAGRLAGVRVAQHNGIPGEALEILIRGGLAVASKPLFVVNGVPLKDFDPATINKNDIKTFQVLKDAAATSIYGSRGSNGVIVITTKQGSHGSGPMVHFNFDFGLSQVTNKLNTMNPYQYVKNLETQELARDGFRKGYNYNNNFFSLWGSPENYKNSHGRNYFDEVFKIAKFNRLNFSYKQGGKNSKLYFSLGLVDQEGVMVATGFKKINSNITFNQKIGKKVSFKASVNYTNSNKYGVSIDNSSLEGFFYGLVSLRPINPISFDEPITNVDLGEYFYNSDHKASTHQIRTNFSIRYEIFKNLNINSVNGLDVFTGKQKNIYNIEDIPENRIIGFEDNKDSKNFTSVNTVAYEKTFTKLNFQVLGGFEYEQTKLENSYGWIRNQEYLTDFESPRIS